MDLTKTQQAFWESVKGLKITEGICDRAEKSNIGFRGFTTQPIKYFSISQRHLFCRIPRILESGTQVKQTNKQKPLAGAKYRY